jgi:predicted Fe-S protein YdhL (DUF1289 family)
MSDVPSPCIGICSIDLDTDLCNGCFRTMDEISNWFDASVQEKQKILESIAARKQELFS